MRAEVPNLDALQAAAVQFVEQIGTDRIFLFDGKMGAGKTTFIKAICEQLGVQEVVNSPTFSIVNEYETASGDRIYHFDCYRLNSADEARNIGAEDYLYSGQLCFIEWAENIAALLPDSARRVTIQVDDNEKRTISF